MCEAIHLAETDKTAAIQALERIKNSLQYDDAKAQLSRVIAVLQTPPRPQPIPAYSYSRSTQGTSTYTRQSSGSGAGAIIAAISFLLIIVAILVWLALQGGF